MGVGLKGALVAGALVALVPAAAVLAKPARPVTTKAKARTHIDWSRGLVVATAGQATDLRAPRPAIARIAAERGARARATEAAAAAVKALPLSPSGTVGDAAKDADVAARLERAVAAARDLDISYSTDGSVTITVAIALEAVRRAIVGTAPAPAINASAPTAVIVDARRVLRAPHLGIELKRQDASYRGPVVFYRGSAEIPDDRLGPRVAIARAARYHHGTLILTDPLHWQDHPDPLPTGLADAASAGAVVVVILGDTR
ncbi:MAG TPA: hypothetical protein VFG83_07810 [Kofleriaceae bacterium]|nr:hypothetical protein [Kofleriaceae bacterium]